jgi:hypothetical protein
MSQDREKIHDALVLVGCVQKWSLTVSISDKKYKISQNDNKAVSLNVISFHLAARDLI